MPQAAIAPLRFAQRTTGDDKESSVLYAALASVSLLDVCTHRVRAGKLLADESLEAPVFEPARAVLYDLIE